MYNIIHTFLVLVLLVHVLSSTVLSQYLYYHFADFTFTMNVTGCHPLSMGRCWLYHPVLVQCEQRCLG